MVQVFLRRAKTDPFRKGVNIFLGKLGCDICPVTALTNCLVQCPQQQGSVFIYANGSPLLRSEFIKLKKALSHARIDERKYSGHSFRIVVATSVVAAASVPDHMIKMMGRWESSAYLLYVRMPCEYPAALSKVLIQPVQIPQVWTQMLQSSP